MIQFHFVTVFLEKIFDAFGSSVDIIAGAPSRVRLCSSSIAAGTRV
jgi:hypothetical protein